MGRHSKYPDEAGIYKLTCSVNGKIYIGKTVNFRERMSKHKRCEKHNSDKNPISNSINKYGWDVFDVEILNIYENFDRNNPTHNLDLLDRENQYMELYNTYNRDVGYNICKYSSDRTGIPHTEETKEKLRRANLGKIHTDETKKILSEMGSGENHPMYGKHYDKDKLESRSGENSCWYGKTGKLHPTYGRKHSDDGIQKIKEKRIDQDMSFCRKTVIQLDMKDNILMVWEGANHAEKSLGILSRSIRRVCNGQGKSAGGYRWKFLT